MRENNAQRVIYNFLSGKFYHPKGDKMRVDESGRIFDGGAIIGIFLEDELDGVWTKYLLLPLQDFRGDPSWKRHKQQLVKAANEMGIRVIFSKYFDIGFGTDNIEPYEYYCKKVSDELFKDLIKVARYSTDDIKTAASVNGNDFADILFSFNQQIDDKFIHAEMVLADYVRMTNGNCSRWVTLLEPCGQCISDMINVSIQRPTITFSYPHKDKWNTLAYIELTNDIAAKRIIKNGQPVLYYRQQNNKVDKFYEVTKC